MAENQPPNAPGDAAGVPFYEKQRHMLHSMINKRRLLERNLANLEDNIAKKESEYLEDTPNGNIITGFEGYTKGTTAAPGQRRRGALQETNKVFSRSSVTFNANAVSIIPLYWLADLARTEYYSTRLVK
jgi:chromatin modification-related protein EAF6